jgi:hypothetical protein
MVDRVDNGRQVDNQGSGSNTPECMRNGRFSRYHYLTTSAWADDGVGSSF